ncbi:stromal processing peptidase, chloroplastic [Olea europaea subsp. europaea]|uniref:Stromal processing peptidase, chloroplastic n=1 Tax=Olea europaea subsp. europaea TaxID=158383 RepID=A0A8S0R8H1_OLEEU|nr:stromal processing peptidase, chloroplastic [Olea europaea subsp. europaea]
MQTTSVIFNTKLLLSPIHASNYHYNDKNSRYSPVIAHQCKKSSVTLRPHRRRCSRPYLISPQNTWRRSSELNEFLPQARSLDSCRHVSCFSSQKRKQAGFSRLNTGVFLEKSTFHLSRKKLDNAKVQQVHVPMATVGPEEPHAASTAWPDGVVEKQGLDFLDPEVERTEFKQFLSYELPSHPKLHKGQLKNGLRYIILPNKVPPNR